MTEEDASPFVKCLQTINHNPVIHCLNSSLPLGLRLLWPGSPRHVLLSSIPVKLTLG